MSPDILPAVMALVPRDAAGLRIDLNGHGETTHHPDWTRIARTALESDARVTIISNFAKPFDEEEIAVLSKMSMIQISLDTVDETLLRQLRRRVSLGVVLRNIHLVRLKAHKEGRHPEWSISCGVFDRSIPGLGDLARFVASAGFDSVVFWNLVEYPDVPEGIRVRSLASMPESERRSAAAAVKDAASFLMKYGVRVELAGGFLELPRHSRGMTWLRNVVRRLLRRILL